MKAFIIAEAGVNHNGSLKTAKKMVDAAKESGADCIKFQTFIAENIASKNAKKADYQKNEKVKDESQLNMLKKLELSFDDFKELKFYCKEKEIEFLSTAFDLESIDFLESLGMKTWKIPSGDITNLPYIEKIGKLKGKVILSTGMSTMDEIRSTIKVLKEKGTKDIIVLHCTTEYPTPYGEVNLKAMNYMKDEFNLEVGYSDHTKGIEVSLAAVALGARIIEKHFTLDKNMEGPDHKASLEPKDLKRMVDGIRIIEESLGSPTKKVQKSEEKNIKIARKSIVAKNDIKKGDYFSEENLTTKRPGNGISPMVWHEIIGKRSNKDFKKDEMIKL